jgi:hypothetical protein
MLARLSPGPRLRLVLPLHDSSKTGKKNSQVHIYFSFLVFKTFMLTPEFRLTNQVGIAGDVRQEPLSFDLDNK